MPFVYHRLNLRGLAALPIDYKSEKREKLEAMREALFSEILNLKFTEVELDGRRFKLVPIVKPPNRS